jgi:uncharacterized protein
MDTPKHKEYPQLMADKKILYVHGFASSAQSGTVELLRSLMPQTEIIAHDLPLHPAEALALLRRVCAEQQPDLIIGSSAGAMMAETLTGFDRILVNPAFQMGDTMLKRDMLGRMTYQNPRSDGVQEFIVTKALVKEFADTTAQCFAHVDDEERKHVWGLFGDEDDVVHTFDLFLSHYPNAIRFHGGHRLTDHTALHYLVPLIRQIDDRQQGRERPVVYITTSALANANGQPTPSMHKAYEMLLESYDVRIVAPAPTNEPTLPERTQAWVAEYLSAPAFNRIIHTNSPELLYGDYMISRDDCPDFMGTLIQIGTDGMKAWDDIIVYFSRLGGQ